MTLATTDNTSHQTPAVSSKSKVSDEMTMLIGVLLFLVMWIGSVVAFGLPGLYIPAVALVPFLVGLLVYIAWG